MHIMHVLRGIVWEVADSGERVIIGRYYPPQPTLWQKMPMFWKRRNTVYRNREIQVPQSEKYKFHNQRNVYNNIFCRWVIIIGRYYPPQPTLWQKMPMIQKLRNIIYRNREIQVLQSEEYKIQNQRNVYDNIFCRWVNIGRYYPLQPTIWQKQLNPGSLLLKVKMNI